ncbi:hypothetical protein GLOTRDRAFT_132514 [Gloeophyllum trabeum ATCC 11539]|uniref:Uncharacterized protein n=1 Tax=Gloeophyllum trabeum (strain ATCC 11539 / FP-39264 / Madison 617) TaxID=670483 RepID=S7RGK8_GLOTA|nr:uncharacterized protein GLOTRDRAFT_132514 [Gloeophyllum trabeum ATCC 11539]EPQ51694.1 hypothetical protein GLOTRDRAFT_132514 [Gloeophyllum trabeum ATCC 11539]
MTIIQETTITPGVSYLQIWGSDLPFIFEFNLVSAHELGPDRLRLRQDALRLTSVDSHLPSWEVPDSESDEESVSEMLGRRAIEEVNE